MRANPRPPCEASPSPLIGCVSLKYFNTGAFTISFNHSKALSCLSIQFHSTSFRVSRHKGLHISERNFDRYFKRPRNCCTAWTSVGSFIVWIATTFLESGFDPSFVIIWPMNDTSSHLYRNFSLFNLTFLSRHHSRRPVNLGRDHTYLASCCTSPLPIMRILSAILYTSGYASRH